MSDLVYSTTTYKLPRRLRVRLWRRIRGTYGTTVSVTAKHWWSRKERKTARFAAALMDMHAREIHRAVMRGLLYGDGFVRPVWGGGHHDHLHLRP